MMRRFLIIVVTLIAIILINGWHLFGTSSLGVLCNLALTIWIISRAYARLKKAGRSVFTTIPVPKPTTAGSWPPLLVIVLIVVFIFATAGYQLVSAAGYNFFVWGDHLLGAGIQPQPVIRWAIAGFLFGCVAGSIVIWRKYRLKFQWSLISVILLVLLVAGLQYTRSPFEAVEPRPLGTVADTSSARPQDSVVHFDRPKTTKIGKVSRPEITPVVPKASCLTQLADISINARGDSVTIYYRTAAGDDCSWSDWKTKFIPQQGQFALTDDGPVRANKLQYYYEVKSVFTRSAQNPYARALCDGPLVMDTY